MSKRYVLGPWRAVPVEGGHEIVSASGEVLGVIYDVEGADGANARAVTALPELIQAAVISLGLLQAAIDGADGARKGIDAIRTAVDKAVGS